MSVPVVISKATAYVTKTNCKHPGTAAEATAAEAQAKTDIESQLPTGVTVTIAAGTVKRAA